MVRRAVAQHIVQQIKHRQIAKRRRVLRTLSAGIASADVSGGGSGALGAFVAASDGAASAGTYSSAIATTTRPAASASADVSSIVSNDVFWTDCNDGALDSSQSCSGRQYQHQNQHQLDLHDTAAAIAALAAALSAVRTDSCSACLHTPLYAAMALILDHVDRTSDPYLPAPVSTTPNTESQLVQRIIELQREKEHLLQMMQHQPS
ncbi:hypothetical protein IWW48_006359 [Coemansia sp. RSA 1200]|nr:hypothetical protein IWW48_006359 [Coemansia sp. RSA 1200]